MMLRQDFTPTGVLQPVAAPESLTGTIGGFGSAAASLISDIKSGYIALDIPDVEEWLRKFSSLVDLVDSHRTDLIMAATFGALDTGLSSCELSRQIAVKVADRTGDTEGGLAWAVDEVVRELRSIHQALSDSKATLVATNAAIADDLNRSALPGSETANSG